MQKYFTQILIGSGFIGFTLTMLLYFNIPDWKRNPYTGEYEKNTFHEIAMDQNAIIDFYNTQKIISAKKNLTNLDTIISTFSRFSKHIESIPDQKNDTNTVAKDSIKNTLYRIRQNLASNYYQQTEIILNQDTLRKYRQGKSVTFYDSAEVKDFIERSVALINNPRKKDSLNFLIFDTANKNFSYHIKARVRARIYDSNVDFFVKYPSFGLWALLVTAVISTWCILIMIFFAGLRQFRILVRSHSRLTGIHLTRKTLIKFFISSLLLVSVFFVIAKLTVYDKRNIVPVELFINDYLLKYYFLLLMGLLIASIFFGGYLVMGDILKECTLKTKDTNSPEKTKAIGIISDAATDNLQKYFLTTSLSLTGVVVITGVLFSAVNSLDFCKLYAASFKSNFLNYDTVYLFGGLYSLLILLFYLPLRLTFSQLKKSAAPVPGGAPASPPGKFNLSKDFWNRFKELLTVSTPLLAGVLQMIIELFTK